MTEENREGSIVAPDQCCKGALFEMRRRYRWDRWRLASFFVFCFLLLLPQQACVTGESSLESESELGFLWEARRNEQVITLLGTMHVGVAEADIPPLIWQRLEEADKLIIEADIREMSPSLARRYLTLPPPQTLEELLGPEAWRALTAIFQRAYPDLSLEQLRRQSLALTASQLMMAAAAESGAATNPGAPSMDQLIFERAQTSGKATATLETLAEQLSLLEQVFTPEQLRELIANYEDEKAQYQSLERAYREGRSQVIAALIKDMPPPMRELLLDQRNLRWNRSLERLLSPGHTFLAVGAAHYGGEQSLLRLLRAQGFSIRALKIKD